jgi:hypothetical protein
VLEEGPKLEIVAPSEIFLPAADVVARRLGDSAVLIRLTTNRIYELNPTGARVWDLVGSGTTVGMMHETLAEEFDVSADTVGGDVDALLRQLLQEGLVIDTGNGA